MRLPGKVNYHLVVSPLDLQMKQDILGDLETHGAWNSLEEAGRGTRLSNPGRIGYPAIMNRGIGRVCSKPAVCSLF
jgi:hypothetical protein